MEESTHHCTFIDCYYTSHSLWKIWLVESIQSIHNSLWTWHDKCNICWIYCIYHAWLLSPLECSPQKQNGSTLRFCFWGWVMWKMYKKNNYWIRFLHDIMNYQNLMSVISASALASALADNTALTFDNSWYRAQPHPIIV